MQGDAYARRGARNLGMRFRTWRPQKEVTTRALQLWLFTTTLTLLSIIIFLIVSVLSMMYLPTLAFYVVTITVGVALSVGIAALVRMFLQN
jgi:hypothetical protein